MLDIPTSALFILYSLTVSHTLFFNLPAYFLLVYLSKKQQYYSDEEGFLSALKEEQGENGFGYDCIFESADLNKTFGEATKEEKDIRKFAIDQEKLEKMIGDLL